MLKKRSLSIKTLMSFSLLVLGLNSHLLYANNAKCICQYLQTYTATSTMIEITTLCEVFERHRLQGNSPKTFKKTIPYNCQMHELAFNFSLNESDKNYYEIHPDYSKYLKHSDQVPEDTTYACTIL